VSAPLALIIGATSGIANAIARELGARGHALALVARDARRLDAASTDLQERGARVERCDNVDLLDPAAVDMLFDVLSRELPKPAVVLIAHGIMLSNEQCAQDAAELRRMVDTNFTSVAHCAQRALGLFDAQRGGELMVISSVAGDRGRPKNYCYGATKAALDAWLEGFALANAERGVHVINLKPGPVDTAMNAHVLDKGAMWSTPEQIARVACAALGTRRHRVYAPRWWSVVMFVVRALPGALLRRLKV
jgi:decaprenylphospho-beta-D-erythro-pentofuranosid-2-ulose 2-reductase